MLSGIVLLLLDWRLALLTFVLPPLFALAAARPGRGRCAAVGVRSGGVAGQAG
ncbi:MULTISPECIES: hypothetical protein [Pseudomonadota]|uniref:hypothetical protein n=1 Tax=Pseudomonadota TaxID=1224 RepID=UPI0015FDAD5B|nr:MULTISPECIES: hypothetical protein [Pseudomonadota]EIU1655426.1 hypothetical protein [Pseudomonas aeruginosa]MCX2519790.1 hypothetical protein [Pseudomonas aeruginosa]